MRASYRVLSVKSFAQKLATATGLAVQADDLLSPDKLISRFRDAGWTIPPLSPSPGSGSDARDFVRMFGDQSDSETLAVTDGTLVALRAAVALPPTALRLFLDDHQTTFGERAFDFDAVFWTESTERILVHHHERLFTIISR